MDLRSGNFDFTISSQPQGGGVNTDINLGLTEDNQAFNVNQAQNFGFNNNYTFSNTFVFGSDFSNQPSVDSTNTESDVDLSAGQPIDSTIDNIIQNELSPEGILRNRPRIKDPTIGIRIFKEALFKSGYQFNDAKYLKDYPDVAADPIYGQDPEKHYVEHGSSENRNAYLYGEGDHQKLLDSLRFRDVS
jgi:hypothetical protein